MPRSPETLDAQVVHHLFPAVDPSHYRKLAPIVAATCADFSVPYTAFRSWPEAWARHVGWVASLNAENPSAATPAAAVAVGKEARRPADSDGRKGSS